MPLMPKLLMTFRATAVLLCAALGACDAGMASTKAALGHDSYHVVLETRPVHPATFLDSYKPAYTFCVRAARVTGSTVPLHAFPVLTGDYAVERYTTVSDGASFYVEAVRSIVSGNLTPEGGCEMRMAWAGSRTVIHAGQRQSTRIDADGALRVTAPEPAGWPGERSDNDDTTALLAYPLRKTVNGVVMACAPDSAAAARAGMAPMDMCVDAGAGHPVLRNLQGKPLLLHLRSKLALSDGLDTQDVVTAPRRFVTGQPVDAALFRLLPASK
jgi:hypothetical protein